MTAAGSARRCECHGQVETEELLKQAGLPHRYRGCTLDAFNPAASESGRDQLLGALADCRRYVESFVEPDGRFRESGLLLFGPPGVGKTHLAVAVLIALIESYGVRGRFVDLTSLIHQIQSTFSTQTAESKHGILDPIRYAEVLVLDELGAQKPSAWIADLLYLVVNTRYSCRLPTIFTSNCRLEEPVSLDRPADSAYGPTLLTQRIPAMLVSRLYEMAKPIRMDAAEDYRRDIKMHQLSEL